MVSEATVHRDLTICLTDARIHDRVAGLNPNRRPSGRTSVRLCSGRWPAMPSDCVSDAAAQSSSYAGGLRGVSTDCQRPDVEMPVASTYPQLWPVQLPRYV